LPYAQKHEYEDFWDYWTGYFSTRPVLKGMISDMNRDLLSTKALVALSSMSQISKDPKKDFSNSLQEKDSLIKVEQQASVMLHHDGITGTNTEPTFLDYK